MNRLDFFPTLELVQSGSFLTERQSTAVFDEIFAGNVHEDELADFLIALARRRPAVAEITGAAKSMRTNMQSQYRSATWRN